MKTITEARLHPQAGNARSKAFEKSGTRFAAILLAAATAMAVSACSNDDKNNGDGGSAEQPQTIVISGFTATDNSPDSVKLIVGGAAVAKVAYSTSITLTLPESVDGSLMEAANKVSLIMTG